MKQTVLPARRWYQTDDGRWASREKTAEDYAADRELKASLGAGDSTSIFSTFSHPGVRNAASLGEAVRATREAINEAFE